MGPIYHLADRDVHLAISECLRILKPEGIFFAAYVNKYEGCKSDKYYGNLIRFRSCEEFRKLIGRFPVKEICHVPVDGSSFNELGNLMGQFSDDLEPLHA